MYSTIDRCIERYIDIQKDRQIFRERQIAIEKDRQPQRKIDSYRERQIAIEKDRQIDCYINIEFIDQKDILNAIPLLELYNVLCY